MSNTTVANDLVIEALRRAGKKNVAGGQQSGDVQYGREVWLPSVVDDVIARAGMMGVRQFRALQKSVGLIGLQYANGVTLPSDFWRPLQIARVKGDVSGTTPVGASTASTLNMAVSATVTAAQVEGKEVFVTSGVAAGLWRTIVDYNETTDVASVWPDWPTTKVPTGSETYFVIDDRMTVDRENTRITADYRTSTTARDPVEFAIWDERLMFGAPMDAAYSFQVLYYARPSKLALDEDTTGGTVWTRVLEQWRTVIELGLEIRAKNETDDASSRDADKTMRDAVAQLFFEQLDQGDEFEHYALEPM